jgi:hypothetical protein
MHTHSDDIPPGLKTLFDASGPIMQYRILRDLLDHDDSWIHTLKRGLELNRLPAIAELMNARGNNGSWNGLLIGLNENEFRKSTAFSMLRLCEWTREEHPIIPQTIEKVLLPTLTRDDFLWEFAAVARTENEKLTARHLVRDTILFLMCRSLQTKNDLIRLQLEIVLTEWELFVAKHDLRRAPTLFGYAAVCWYPWDDDEFLRVRELAVKLFDALEGSIDKKIEFPPWLEPHCLKLYPKESFLAHPARLFYHLELSARLGITSDLPVTKWLLEELQFRQDADGIVRFEHNELPPESLEYYFPLEAASVEDYPVEYTFRADLIFKLLGYDF